MNQYRSLAPDQFEAQMWEEEEVVLLDVRSPMEFSLRHIEGCMQLDYHSREFREVVQILDPEITYLVYCENGETSTKACEALIKKKFKKVCLLEGGIDAWETAEKDTIRADDFSDDALKKLSEALFFLD